MDNEWITVAEAARILGVSKQAVRQRIYRDTIPHSKDEDGTVFVRITDDNAETNGESHAENTGYTGDVGRELIDELRDRVGFLERQLETEQAASAELRRIVAGLVQRVPELEAAPETREAPESAARTSDTAEPRSTTEEQQEQTSRPWWRRIFGE
jgi:helix-turn-helix protein